MNHCDSQRQLDTATAYFLAAERCSPETKFDCYGMHEVHAPVITSYALSVEILLKLICHLTGKLPGANHSLKQLLSKIPSDTTDRLPHLSACVDEIDSYFVNWRYPYEKDFLMGDYDGPRRAFIECYREVRRLNSDLMSVYEKNWGFFDPKWLQTWGHGQFEMQPVTRND